MKTLLVIRSSAMGDVAMAAPVLAQLAQHYPDVKIVMLTRDFYEPFFDNIDNLTIHNIDLAEKHRGIPGIYRLYKELKETYKIDFIVDLNDKLYSKLLRRIFKYSGVHSTHIDKGRDDKKALTRKTNKTLQSLQTSINRYVQAFEAAGYTLDVPNAYTHVRKPLPLVFQTLPEKIIGVAPFAKHQGKILPLTTVRKFIELMQEKHPDYKILIFGGGSAERMVTDSLTAWYPNCVSAVSKVTLADELALISNLQLMVSMDSSAMHMSSLVGTPVVSVWGATHHYAGFLGLGQSIDNIVSVDLPCRPCSVYGHKPCYRRDYACLTQITAENLYAAVEKLLKQLNN